MKEWKQAVSDRIVKEARDTKIVMLRDVAASMQILHINRQDAMDIMRDAASRCPDMKLVRLAKNEFNMSSFFQTACLIDKTVDFEDEESELLYD